jgi:hypothetical protein
MPLVYKRLSEQFIVTPDGSSRYEATKKGTGAGASVGTSALLLHVTSN